MLPKFAALVHAASSHLGDSVLGYLALKAELGHLKELLQLAQGGDKAGGW